MARSAGYSWIGLLGAFLYVWLMRQSAPLAGLSLAPFWAALTHTGAFASAPGWLSLVLPRWVLVLCCWKKKPYCWLHSKHLQRSLSCSWCGAGQPECKASQLAWRKEYYHLWWPLVKERGKCSEILPKSSLAFSLPQSLALWRGSCPERPEWMGIRVGLKEHWDREVQGLLITITWALSYCRILQILLPILPGGLAFSATAADPVDLICQQPDALIHITVTIRATRMHGGIWLL